MEFVLGKFMVIANFSNAIWNDKFSGTNNQFFNFIFDRDNYNIGNIGRGVGIGNTDFGKDYFVVKLPFVEIHTINSRGIREFAVGKCGNKV